ncbi:MAG: M23 family metallopeptidase [Candidatus Sumerlaeia bacterium]|nr:M23 family metallopeptidase [Candidatus Sumerlaeia bacterium]
MGRVTTGLLLAALPVLAAAVAPLDCPDTGVDFSALPLVEPVPSSFALPASEVSFDWPITSTPVLNSPFGPRQLGSQGARYDWHRGVDLTLPIGTTLRAPADAVVVFAGRHAGFTDPVVQLRHTSAEPYVYSLYLHVQEEQIVGAGQEVLRGDPIALSGQGTATYPHLHWEVRHGCLLQVCCKNPYGFMGIANAPPPPPTLLAAGDDGRYGRMLLLGWSFPRTEIDFGGAVLRWGGATRTAHIDSLNALAPSNNAAALDNPLYFAQNHQMPFAYLPGRFNSTFQTSDYQWLVWNLSTTISTGEADVLDAAGLKSTAALALAANPAFLRARTDATTLTPTASFSFVYDATNRDTVARELTFGAASAQAITLSVQPSQATLSAGESLPVTVSGTLAGRPVGQGDVIVLRASVAGFAGQDALAVTLIDTATDPPASKPGAWLIR